MVLSVQALSLKDPTRCPGLSGSSIINLNIFTNMAVTCYMKIHDMIINQKRRLHKIRREIISCFIKLAFFMDIIDATRTLSII
jgi:hypothetical protein